jgi:hypothetical protein
VVASVDELTTSQTRSRSRPWDAGPEATARDLIALRWITEQYTARLDVAAVVLGRLSPVGARTPGRLGPRTLRQRLERWEQAGWTIRRRLLGHTWIVPTTAGIRLTGLELDPWEPNAARLTHHHAVALVRLAREPAPGQAGWICERELWRRRGKASWHLADGALPVPVPTLWQARGIGEAFELVEAELHEKARRHTLAAFKTLPPATAQVTYYTPPALHAALSAQVASVTRELGGSLVVRVELLPEVAGIGWEVAA